jgi:signal transduction histidine kinase
MFLVSGAVLRRPQTARRRTARPRNRIMNSPAGQEFLRLVQTQQQVQELRQLEIESAIALGIVAILSGLLGWLVAGRVLRPLRTITATTQQISEGNLHRRLNLPGPRDELRTLADTIDSLLARLEAAFEAQRRFVAKETLLARMVDNLIDNAVRHNLPRGLIDVTCEADRGMARLVIESGGPVLGLEAVGQLAEPFRRLGAERTGCHDGHGLGLSIVAAVAAAHGGELRLYARERGGLGAEISLPAALDA